MPKKSGALHFNLTQEELEYQVANYSTLRMWQTYRGQTVLFFVFIQAISVLYFALLPEEGVGIIQASIGGLIIYGPLLFFVYMGHRWAIIGLMILWTVDKVWTTFDQINSGMHVNIAAVIFLLLGLAVSWKAFQVENAKLAVRSAVAPTTP